MLSRMMNRSIQWIGVLVFVVFCIPQANASNAMCHTLYETKLHADFHKPGHHTYALAKSYKELWEKTGDYSSVSYAIGVLASPWLPVVGALTVALDICTLPVNAVKSICHAVNQHEYANTLQLVAVLQQMNQGAIDLSKIQETAAFSKIAKHFNITLERYEVLAQAIHAEFADITSSAFCGEDVFAPDYKNIEALIASLSQGRTFQAQLK